MRYTSKMGPTRGAMAERSLKMAESQQFGFGVICGKPVFDIPPTPFGPKAPPPHPHSHRPPPPLYCIVSPKIAHFKAFWEIAWAKNGSKMGQKCLKIALFEPPKWCRNNFVENHFGPLLDPRVTPVTLPEHVHRGRSTTPCCQWGLEGC